MKKPKNLHARPIDMNKGGGIAGGKRGAGWRGQRGKNWDNSKSIINKIYFKKKDAARS